MTVAFSSRGAENGSRRAKKVLLPGFSMHAKGCLLLASIMMITGCSLFEAKETRYLRHAEGQARQEEVKRELGAPTFSETARSGEAIWIYDIWDWQPGNRFTTPGAQCDEYILYFDQQEVLRRWTHQNYLHGGESFPSYCVPNR